MINGLKSKLKVFFVGLIFFCLPIFVFADYDGQQTNFFVNSDYDLSIRGDVTATLEKTGRHLYFYLDQEWWGPLAYKEKLEIRQAISSLNQEFENRIYPVLTSAFGSEWSPGVDNDEKVTVLFHPMVEEVRGYFNPGDEYSRFQVSSSNEREMVYLNINSFQDSRLKSFLAHEFVHLITFNQKERKRGVSEEIWLNEMRAEYAPTLLGYDQDFEGSNLQNRVQDFLARPNTSLTSWGGERFDYGVINLFSQYLTDHYGKEILTDSLLSSKTGISSLNYALEKNGFEQDFSQIFTDWTVALLINNCDVSPKYCYLNENLKEVRVSPLINFLPLVGESSLHYGNSTQDWTGNWLKIIGGQGALKFEFSGTREVEFNVVYVLEDLKGNLEIKELALNSDQQGTIYIPDFGTQNVSFTIIPSIQSKTSGFKTLEPFYSFFWSASTQKDEELTEEKIKNELLAQIELLKKQIAEVQARINAILGVSEVSCEGFEKNLYFGMKGDNVRCLQEALKQQGAMIYPEGLITGYFGRLTQNAVIRFQEKYSSDCLSPWGINSGTGYVGTTTREKLNSLLGK